MDRTAVITLTGALLGGLLTFLTTRAQLHVEAENAFDRSLRDLRLPHYQRLFHLTEAIPREWIMVQSPDRSYLLGLRERFHQWYFQEAASGMFLSQASREAYFGLQNELRIAAGQLTSDAQVLDDEASACLRRRASDLRHQLSADLGLAQAPRRGWSAPRSVPLPGRAESQAR